MSEEEKQIREKKIHTTVERPWGSYTILEEGKGYKIKRVVVKPGKKLSLQYHQKRSEHWVVVTGQAKVTIGEQEFLATVDRSVYVPKGGAHRLENSTDSITEIIEVQCGEYLEEDDIVRIKDDFGRV